MALVAIIGGALLSGVELALRLSERAQRRARASVALLAADDRLRAAMADVRIPYWERSVEIRRDGGDLLLPWFQGVRDRTLRVGPRDGRLFMEANGAALRFEWIEDPEVRVLPSDGAPFALEVSFTVEAHAARLVAPFGAHPLGAGSLRGGAE